MSEGLMSPDGKSMLVRSSGAPTGRDIWYVNTANATEPHPFEVTPFDERMPRFSPDGRWVAYVSTESGDASVYVRPFPGPGGRVQVAGDILNGISVNADLHASAEYRSHLARVAAKRAIQTALGRAG